ncbi:hypothetical protein [Breznakiella homolactica]|uniref:Uncharacterized protein n=1 Tax=Breznakiella homolactica TaxID=2798577 RepID=A0A7T7XNW0_9SPIR|nr:hypothetical protein [Breznakiella homolactica]QQO09810.1 hypothetical protein JFL75_02560 [Breznakiella homolactica]
MTRPVIILFLLIFLFSGPAIFSQEAGSELFEFDFDSLFDEPPPLPEDGSSPEKGSSEPAEPSALRTNFRPRGFSIDASYSFIGGFSPGLSEVPWADAERDSEYSYVLGIEASAALALDFQISNSMRVRQVTGFSFPSLNLEIKEFFLDYNFSERVFARAGKFTANWGISRNYEFANLLSRIPSVITSPGDPYMFKLDIPIGIGGAQLIALTRRGFMDYDGNSDPSFKEIGYGGKYNLAFRRADIDLSVFYHDLLPLYGAFSVKSTLFRKTEVYAEGLISVSHENWDNVRLSGNIGFIQDFLADKLTVNAEFFYNGEKNALWYEPENDIKEAEVSSLVGGINTALNVVWRPVNWKSFRIYGRFLYGYEENTGLFVPGISFSPFENMTVYLIGNIALGSYDGTYYRQNEDKRNRPFGVTLAVQVSGNYRYGWYEH